MTSQHRRTPCIGICSTTYGDLVCRGCKRFAHEIVQWNGYEASQQQTVWQRLSQLRIDIVNRHFRLVDASKLEQLRISFAVQADAWELVVWQLLKVVDPHTSLMNAGIDLLDNQDIEHSPAKLATSLDQEFYATSLAYYERSFHTLAQ